MTILEDLARSAAFDLVFIDNASEDGTGTLLSTIEGSTCQLNDSNRGFAAAVNQALGGELRYKYFILLNPDASISVGDLERLIDFMDEEPGLAACSPSLVSEMGEHMGFWARGSSAAAMLVDDLTLGLFMRIGPLRRRFGHLSANDIRPGVRPGFISGAVFVGRVEALRQVGLFDDRFFLYYEEADWCRRATAAGWRLGLVPGFEAVHRMYGSSESEGVARELYYASRYAFLKKHYGRAVESAIRVADAVSGAILWSAGSLLRGMLADMAQDAAVEGRTRTVSAWRLKR
jgi:GT2 family glycosyltransferase